MQTILLTGMTPTGYVHLGNYIGAIKPTLKMCSYSPLQTNLVLIADYHSLTKLSKSSQRKQYISHMVAVWLSLNEDKNKLIIFKQSDIPEILHLNWILNSLVTLNSLKRCHAYKASENPNVSMSLFNYPILMAADILSFNSTIIPVGKDQLQHIELAKCMANKFNTLYDRPVFNIPQPFIVDGNEGSLKGIDGRKMSKSYNNTIPCFVSKEKLKKLIFSIPTSSQLECEEKSISNCILFDLYKNFASEEDISLLKSKYKSGIGWKLVKEELYEVLLKFMLPFHDKYDYFINNEHLISQILDEGREKAIQISSSTLKIVKDCLNI